MANTAFEHSPTLQVPGSTTTNGLVTWDANDGAGFLSSSVVLSTGGALSTLTSLVVDTITIDGTSITTTASNNPINLTPHGTGAVVITKTSTPTILLTNSTNAYAITLNTGTTAANYTITMPTAAPTAAGKVLKSSGSSPFSTLEGGDATDTNTTYTHTWQDSSTNAILRLTPSSGSNDDLTIIAGTNITLTPSGDNLTIDAAGGGAADDYFASSGLSSKDQGDGLHIKIGDSGGTASSAGNELIIEGAGGNIGMSILGNGTGGSYIYLGDGAAPSRAGINYSHGDDQLVLRSGDNTRMIIAAGGAITKPAQPCFGRRLSSSVTNVTGNGDGYVVVWEALSSFGYDYGGNCESNNTTFTAPVDGIYWFEAALTMTHVADNHTEGYIRIKTTSSPWLELINYFQPYANETSINSFTPVNITGTMELNADQGVVVDIKVYGGSKIVDINGSTNIHSRWSGMLVA